MIDGLPGRSAVLVHNGSSVGESVKPGQLLCTISSVVDSSWIEPSGEVHMVGDPIRGKTFIQDIETIELGYHLNDQEKDAIHVLLEQN